jgi:predicted GNAT family acetyltransferase
MAQGIYRCDEVISPKEPQGLFFRPATLDDKNKIGEWIESFHHEAVPHDPPVNGVELAKTKINGGMIFVVEAAGELLSMAGWSRDIGTSCSVNLVFTPIKHRKNGYGSMVTARLTKHLLRRGKKETNLYTDMKNPTSNKIYQEIGYQFVCGSLHLGVVQ